MADDFTKIIGGPAMVYVGTANSTPTTHLGTTGADGVLLSSKATFNERRSGSYLQPVKRRPETLDVTIKFELLEATLTNIDLVLPVGTQTDLASPVTKECSIKIVGTDPDTSGTRTITHLRGNFTADFEHTFKSGSDWVIPCEWHGLACATAPTMVDA